MSEFGQNDSTQRWDGQSWSLAVTSIVGISVRFHLFLLLFLGAVMLSWLGWAGVILAVALLAAILIHEAGHAATTIAVGGPLEEMVILPLGSLRGPRLPNRPIESTLVLLGGPALNLTVCLFLLPLLHLTGDLTASIWNPLVIEDVWHGPRSIGTYFAFFFKANYWLLLLNLLPFYPLDGGRVIRELISVRMNQFQATFITVVIGAVGGLVMFGIGMWFHYVWIASAGFFVTAICLKRFRELELLSENQENEFGYDFSEGYTSLERSMSHTHGVNHTFSNTFKGWLEERRRKKGEQLEAELDRILEKIHTLGITSLSRAERKILAMASRRRRN